MLEEFCLDDILNHGTFLIVLIFVIDRHYKSIVLQVDFSACCNRQSCDAFPIEELCLTNIASVFAFIIASSEPDETAVVNEMPASERKVCRPNALSTYYDR